MFIIRPGEYKIFLLLHHVAIFSSKFTSIKKCIHRNIKKDSIFANRQLDSTTHRPKMKLFQTYTSVQPHITTGKYLIGTNITVSGYNIPKQVLFNLM